MFWRAHLLWAAFTAYAHAADAQGLVTGEVRDSAGAPVRGARVEAVAQARGADTDAAGRFALALARGAHHLVVIANGFAPEWRQVDVGAADTVRLRVTLRPTALSLAAVVVTAGPERRDLASVAAPVSVLSARDLERSLGATLAATLGREPGVHVRSQGPAASMPIIRGLTGDRIVVLQDGQRTADLAASAPDHGVTIDPLAARRVEVVRGPAALLHGSNALGGVVNVLADDIPGSAPARRTWSLAASTESANDGAASLLELSQPLGERTALLVKAGGRSHADMRLPAGGDRDRLDNTSLRNRTLAVGLGHGGTRVAAGATYRRYAFEYGLPWRDDPATAVRLRGGRHEISSRAQLELGGPIEGIRLDATAQWYEHDEVTADGAVATALALRTQQANLLARTAPAGRWMNGAIGANLHLRQNGVEGVQALTPANHAHTAGFFAFQELALGATPASPRAPRLPLGVRIERTGIASLASARFGDAIARTFTAVSASAGLAVPVGTHGSVALNLARAVRTPSPEELFSRAGHAGTGAFEIGNPALGAEVTRGLDLVARLERPTTRAQFAVFHSDVRGWIGLYPAGRDTTVQIGDVVKTLPLMQVSQRPARLTGAEWLVEQQLTGRLVATLTGDVVRARDDAGSPLPFMPPVRTGGALRWDDGRLQVGTSVRRAFAQRRVVEGELAVPGFTQVDAFAGLRLLAGERVHSIMLRADNIGDVASRDATSRVKDFAPNMGRNVTLSYRVIF